VDALAFALDAYGVRPIVPDLQPREELADRVVAARPDLVLLDLDLGEAGDGSLLVRPLVEAGLRVLVVTAAVDVEQIARAVELGAVGVVPKNGPFGDLVSAVVAAAHGQEVMTPLERLHLLDQAHRHRDETMAALAPFGHLTTRECEVLRELARGHSVAEISRQSVVSEATVRSQVQSILTKLGVRSQLEAVVAAQRSGWS
jgi:DNA-binding NarL/FixJ family response regulator